MAARSGLPARSSRTEVAAVSRMDWNWLIAWVRALIALRRATRSMRSDSTGPSPVLGVAAASPESTAIAALIASMVSFLPCRRRRCRLGRLTSVTVSPPPRR